MADITREHVAGAIKLINAAGVAPRREALRKMFIAEGYTDGDHFHSISKALSDLESYPDWAKGAALDAPPAPAPAADPAPSEPPAA